MWVMKERINFHAVFVGLITGLTSVLFMIFLASNTVDVFEREKNVIDRLSVGYTVTANDVLLDPAAANGLVRDLKLYAVERRTLRGSPTNSLYRIQIMSDKGDVSINLYRDSREPDLYWMYFPEKEYKHWRIRTTFLNELTPKLVDRFH